ncbi:hypothetical protein [Paludibaculum fermentans]|uniref:hypothetical protein n=1 Tax=Paludibaculum fermentans TaxID=1473598 RepID=UPI003EB971FF
MKRLEAGLLKDDWTALRLDEVELKQIAIPGGDETDILCSMRERKEKGKAISKRFSTRVDAALRSLAATMETDRLKGRGKA